MYINASIIFAVIGALGTIFSIVMAIIIFSKSSKKDVELKAAGGAGLVTDIAYIKKGVDDIRLDIKAQERETGVLKERMAKVEESAKSAHHRIDEIVNKI